MQGQKLAELYLDGEQITDFNGALFAELSVVTPEPLTFTATDGYEIHGWVMKPADYEEGKTYPAILHIHGGPRTVFSDVFHHEMQMWANAGYFVFFSNPRGSDGRGTAFGDINGIYGTVDYANLMEFTDKVLEAYPMIDTARVGVTGGSYGGFMTNWIIGHTDRFKAAAT
ncbi:MAG: S9 family peptidase, partial [Lachnospiraceae bacterium]|nr:S9 family peptidase [Lachnospiraceae bacterium]MBR0305844.1 S9 family peptidase [Lachnospiraceae bacterium]